MPLWRKAKEAKSAAPLGEPPTLVASASTFSLAGLGRYTNFSSVAWQSEAWNFYDEVPEFRYVCDHIAKAASRATLYITEVDDAGEPITSDPGSIARSATFLGGPTIQAGLIKQITLHLCVVGECYLVGWITDGGEQWDVFGCEELQTVGDTLQINIGCQGEVLELDPDNSLIIKIWSPHPRRRWEANSPARAARAVMREIVRSDQSLQAQTDSRLTGAGILLLPREMTFHIAGAAQTAGPGDDAGADEFMAALTDAMMTAIQDRDSVAAVVPIIVRGPGDQLDKVRLLSLSTPVSEAQMAVRDAAILRLARTLDANPQASLGSAETNHWSMWFADESDVKVHIEPMLELICNAVTEQILWPMLQGTDVEDFRRFVVWYNLSELIQRPDRGADAQQVYDRGELSGSALRRANGFTESDAPTDDERRERRLLEIAGKVPVAAPAIVNQLLEGFGIDNDVPITVAQGPGTQVKEITRSAPRNQRALPDRPERPQNPTTVTYASAQALLAAAEAVVLHALETAGRRMVGRERWKLNGMAAAQFHSTQPACTPASAERLLKDCLAPAIPVAERAGVDPGTFRDTLHGYLAELLCSANQHDPERLAKSLCAAGLIEGTPI